MVELVMVLIASEVTLWRILSAVSHSLLRLLLRRQWMWQMNWWMRCYTALRCIHCTYFIIIIYIHWSFEGSLFHLYINIFLNHSSFTHSTWLPLHHHILFTTEILLFNLCSSGDLCTVHTYVELFLYHIILLGHFTGLH